MAKFGKAEVREELLREKLERVRYHGPAKMGEFCAEFRVIETQIYDMVFRDRLRAFKKAVPGDLSMYLHDLDYMRRIWQ